MQSLLSHCHHYAHQSYPHTRRPHTSRHHTPPPAPSPHHQRHLRISNHQINLPRDRLRRIRVLARDHHDLDTDEGADRLAHAVVRWVFEKRPTKF
jgi:hypothetical protein